MTLLFVSFIAGVLTTLAPCILPLLPVIIGSSVSEGENKRRPLVIIFSLVVSIVLFTLLLKYSTALVMVSQSTWSLISGGILVLVALTYVFPELWSKIPGISALNRRSNEALATGYGKKSVTGDIVIGAALGPVFSSCSPTYFVILATILPRSLGEGIIHLFAYALGLGIMLLLISLLGQRIIGKLGWATNPKGWFKRGIGILFLLVGVFIMTGSDKALQTYLLEKGLFDITKIETRIVEGLEQ